MSESNGDSKQNLFGYVITNESPEIIKNEKEICLNHLETISNLTIFLLKKKNLNSKIGIIKLKYEVNEEYKTIGILNNSKRSFNFEIIAKFEIYFKVELIDSLIFDKEIKEDKDEIKDEMIKNIMFEKLIENKKLEKNLKKLNEEFKLNFNEKLNKNIKIMKIRQDILNQKSFQILSNLSPNSKDTEEILNWVDISLNEIINEIFIPYKEMLLFFKYFDLINELDSTLNKKILNTIFTILNLLQDKALDKLQQNLSQEQIKRRKSFNLQILKIQNSITQILSKYQFK
eukprot:gene5812-9635_t